ncbi:MAG: M3 family oligoendopeptidase [Polaribacter sp.]|jgi:M3 family oligoendopeptidase
MKFSNYDYQRPSIESLTTQFADLLGQFEAAPNAILQNKLLDEINDLRQSFFSMYNICYIRHTINTKDSFYEEENKFFDSANPDFGALVNKYYRTLLASPFREELEERRGSQLFVIAELSLKTFEPAILEDLKEENKLGSEYVKLKAAAKIEFEGKEYNLSGLIPLETGKDRDTREKASVAKWAYYQKHAEDFDELFDKMVKVRHEMAQKLGYKNYIELGYARMLRSDYNAEMVANYRQQILEHIVPLTQELYKRQQKRLGLDTLFHHDEGFRFPSGNPIPKGSPDWIVENASTMYKELSGETDEFFKFMVDNELMDLVNREGKATGGYCTFVSEHEAPYIFSNFNGTSGDIDVLTHEAGHAFQVYSSRKLGLKEYNWPTYEACEIHSMSMEFFTWPWMELFFKEDTMKYKFSHLTAALKFLPYGVAVDEFQHYVYENPEVSPVERNQKWKEIEKKYLPHRDYNGNSFLEEGRFWQRQNHIFTMPFYYIDYTLAQVCAFQFWKRDQEDHKEAWSSYVNLCKAGGSKPFLELVKLAGLKSPFEEGCVADVVAPIKAWLDQVDDTSF